MADKPETKPDAPKRDPLILSRSEFAALNEEQKQKFRNDGGTVCEDSALSK